MSKTGDATLSLHEGYQGDPVSGRLRCTNISDSKLCL